MQIELPPIKMIDIEREVIIFSVVAGVGQNIPATFGEAQKNVSKNETTLESTRNYTADPTSVKAELKTCDALEQRLTLLSETPH